MALKDADSRIVEYIIYALITIIIVLLVMVPVVIDYKFKNRCDVVDVVNAEIKLKLFDPLSYEIVRSAYDHSEGSAVFFSILYIGDSEVQVDAGQVNSDTCELVKWY